MNSSNSLRNLGVLRVSCGFPLPSDAIKKHKKKVIPLVAAPPEVTPEKARLGPKLSILIESD